MVKRVLQFGLVLSLLAEAMTAIAGGVYSPSPVERFGDTTMAIQFDIGYGAINWLDFSALSTAVVSKHAEHGAVYGGSFSYDVNHHVGLEAGAWSFADITTPTITEGKIHSYAYFMNFKARYAFENFDIVGRVGPLLRAATGAYHKSTASLTTDNVHIWTVNAGVGLEYPTRPDLRLSMQYVYSPEVASGDKALPSVHLLSAGVAYLF